MGIIGIIIFKTFITIIIKKSINDIIIINTKFFFYIFFILTFIDKVSIFIKYNITRDNKIFLSFISSFFISDSLLLMLLLFLPGSLNFLIAKNYDFFSFVIYIYHLLLLYKRRIINKIFQLKFSKFNFLLRILLYFSFD